ncbi:MAG TPA: pilus assembly protein N-terminal domain-containing protein [Abditibacterium sp.]
MKTIVGQPKFRNPSQTTIKESTMVAPPFKKSPQLSARTSSLLTSTKTPQALTLRLGETVLLSYSGRILTKIVDKPTVIRISTPTQTSLAVTGLAEGEAHLALFIARDDKDKEGKPLVLTMEVVSGTSQSVTRTLLVKNGQARLISIPRGILSVSFSNSKVMDARSINEKTLFVRGMVAGKSTLVVFVPRFAGDKVGKAQTYKVEVEGNPPKLQSVDSEKITNLLGQTWPVGEMSFEQFLIQEIEKRDKRIKELDK